MVVETTTDMAPDFVNITGTTLYINIVTQKIDEITELQMLNQLIKSRQVNIQWQNGLSEFTRFKACGNQLFPQSTHVRSENKRNI